MTLYYYYLLFYVLLITSGVQCFGYKSDNNINVGNPKKYRLLHTYEHQIHSNKLLVHDFNVVGPVDNELIKQYLPSEDEKLIIRGTLNNDVLSSNVASRKLSSKKEDKQFVIEMAELAGSVYKTPNIKPPAGWNNTANYTMESYYGYVFVDLKDDTHVYLAFPGSQTWADWYQNIMSYVQNRKFEKPPCTLPSEVFYYNQSIWDIHLCPDYYPIANSIANAVKNRYMNRAMVLTGHSLGGSMAGLAAISTRSYAVTFCAPGYESHARRDGLPTSYPMIDNYVISEDIVPRFDGHLGYICSIDSGLECPWYDLACWVKWVSNKINFLDHHSLVTLLNKIEGKGSPLCSPCCGLKK